MLDVAAGVTGTPPSGVSNAYAMTAVGTNIYLFRDGNYDSGELFRFSTISMEWTMMNTAAGVTGTSPRSTRIFQQNHAMAAVGTDIYHFGGGGDFGGEDCNWSMGRGQTERRVHAEWPVSGWDYDWVGRGRASRVGTRPDGSSYVGHACM
jgi:hypothetical protein